VSLPFLWYSKPKVKTMKKFFDVLLQVLASWTV